jgi:hypothetical protein
MREIRQSTDRGAGVPRPCMGLRPPVCALVALMSVACGEQTHEESLPILQVGMTKAVEPIYDDGELRIFEVKKGLAFPILAPSASARQELNQLQVAPYGRQPWVTIADLQVQVTWTISNLDEEEHVVEMLVDPWNEFGRYYPGLQLTDADNEEYMPNFSGIDERYVVGGRGSGASSRLHGTYTFSDLEETATDLATVMALLDDPPQVEGDSAEEDPTVTYTNHAFHWQNRSDRDLLVAGWVPDTVAGLTGLDIGFRTYEPATVAIEVAVELVDKTGKRLRKEGEERKEVLPPPREIITVGVAP